MVRQVKESLESAPSGPSEKSLQAAKAGPPAQSRLSTDIKNNNTDIHNLNLNNYNTFKLRTRLLDHHDGEHHFGRALRSRIREPEVGRKSFRHLFVVGKQALAFSSTNFGFAA